MKIKLISLIFVIFFITSCGEEKLTPGSFEIFKKAKSVELFAEKSVDSESIVISQENGLDVNYYKGELFTGWVKFQGEIPNYIPVPNFIYFAKNGLNDGSFMSFKWNGIAPQMFEEGYYSKGLKEGEWIEYGPMAKKIMTKFYENGKLINTIKHHSNNSIPNEIISEVPSNAKSSGSKPSFKTNKKPSSPKAIGYSEFKFPPFAIKPWQAGESQSNYYERFRSRDLTFFEGKFDVAIEDRILTDQTDENTGETLKLYENLPYSGWALSNIESEHGKDLTLLTGYIEGHLAYEIGVNKRGKPLVEHEYVFLKNGHLETYMFGDMVLRQEGLINSVDVDNLIKYEITNDPEYKALLQRISPQKLTPFEKLKKEIEAGLDPNSIVKNEFGENVTLLGREIEAGNIKAEKFLIEKKAIIDAPTGYNGGQNCLQLASVNGHFEIIKMLVANGADPNSVGQTNARALELATNDFTDMEKSWEIINFLFKHGADANYKYKNLMDEEFSFALDVAAISDPRFIKLAIQKNSPTYLITSEGNILHTAVRYGFGKNSDTIKVLIDSIDRRERQDFKFGAAKFINGKDYEGKTPLWLAVDKNRVEVAATLIEKNAQIDIPDDRGYFPLHIASLNNNLDLIKLLLQYEADVDSINKWGQSSLYLACENGHFMSVIELLKNKANRDLKTTVGKTALQIATENKHKSIIAAFRKY